jgi:hypothetical protein
MDAASLFLGRELVKWIEAQREVNLPILLNGACKDYADYKGRSSYLKALEDTLKIIEKITLGGPSHARDDEAGP